MEKNLNTYIHRYVYIYIERGVYTYIYMNHCYTLEINKTLHVNYTSIYKNGSERMLLVHRWSQYPPLLSQCIFSSFSYFIHTEQMTSKRLLELVTKGTLVTFSAFPIPKSGCCFYAYNFLSWKSQVLIMSSMSRKKTVHHILHIKP